MYSIALESFLVLTQMPFWGIFAVLVALSIVLISRVLSKHSHMRKAFTTSDGSKVKILKGDTRFSRFSHGPQISLAGRNIAGDDPFLVWNGRHQELVITQPDHVKEFSRKDAKDHTKPTNMNLGDGFGRLLGGAMGIQGGKKWAAMRAHFDPEFSRNASMSKVPLYNDVAVRWLNGLAEPSTSSSLTTSAITGGFVHNIADACRLLPFRLIGLVIYGEAFDHELDEKLVELNKVHDRLMLDAFLGKWTTSRLYNMLPTETRYRRQEFQRAWEELNDNVIGRAKAEGLRCPVAVIHRGIEAGDMSKSEFLQTMDELLFTNIDVTSTAVASLLLNIAENPSFQESLRQEIAHMRSDESCDVQQYIAKRDVLLHFAVLESFRMRPVLWFSLPEKTAIDKEIGGYYVPSGTNIVIDWKRLNTSSSVWGEDSEVFRPERFAGLSPTSYRHAFLRFGFSRERCLGKNISEMILETILIATLESYVLKPSKDKAVRKGRFTVTPDDEVEFIPITVA